MGAREAALPTRPLHSLATLLPSVQAEKVQALWNAIEESTGLKGVRRTPQPHFSWQLANDYDFEALARQAQALAARSKPFLVKTCGLGLFTAPTPVLFIPLIKTAALAEFHKQVWDETKTASASRSVYYRPVVWMPHITLACSDTAAGRLGPVIEELAFQSYDWEFAVDHLAILQQPEEGPARLRARFAFGGS